MTPFIESILGRIRAGIHPNPARDWAVLLIVSAVALAGIVVWSVSVFDTVARGGVIGTLVIKKEPVFNRTLLNEAHALFETRAAEALKYRMGTYRYADPSQ